MLYAEEGLADTKSLIMGGVLLLSYMVVSSGRKQKVKYSTSSLLLLLFLFLH